MAVGPAFMLPSVIVSRVDIATSLTTALDNRLEFSLRAGVTLMPFKIVSDIRRHSAAEFSSAVATSTCIMLTLLCPRRRCRNILVIASCRLGRGDVLEEAQG